MQVMDRKILSIKIKPVINTNRMYREGYFKEIIYTEPAHRY